MYRKILASILGVLVCASAAGALPSRYDLRDYGRVTGIKNQGVPGPCWAFAALGAMESNYLTQNLGKEPDLSEMQLAFYTYKDPDSKRNFSPLHNSGTLRLEGDMFRAAAFLMRLSGPTDEKNLRYNTNMPDSEKKALSRKSPESFKRSMRLRDAYFLAGGQALNDTLRKELIMKHGAIAVSMYSDPLKYHMRNKHYTYYNPEHGKETDHEVLIIGWDDDFPMDNFKPHPSRNGAWLVKNSWGTMRGNEDGYFWMSYDQHTWGGTAFIVERANPKLKHYGYDDLGYCGQANYSWGANIFKTEGSKETLKEAAFYAPNNNLGYELYVYDLGYKIPFSPIAGKLVSSTSGSIKLAGYYTITLPESVSLKGSQYFSVVLKLSRGNFPVEKARAYYSGNAQVNERESYFSKDGKVWVDGITIKSNACVKAFTITR
ncbi:MAG: hypothetical protein IJR85_07600 [Synergistaceae bacterium]|nr:hypothetical protein [Synergistaceae bacterium]